MREKINKENLPQLVVNEVNNILLLSCIPNPNQLKKLRNILTFSEIYYKKPPGYLKRRTLEIEEDIKQKGTKTKRTKIDIDSSWYKIYFT